MGSIDIVFTAFLSLFVITGIFKGFFREIFGFAGILGGIFISLVTFNPLANTISSYFPDIPHLIWTVVSFVVVFILVYICSRLLANLLSHISQKVYLSWLNRLLGGIVGGMKGALIISFILLLLGFFPFQGTLNEIRQNSILFTPLQRLLPAVYNFATSLSYSSKDFEKKLRESIEKGKVKASEEMMKYLFKEKPDSSDVD